LYAKLEEDHGLARRAMAVYDRATRAVQADQQLEVRGHQYVSWILFTRVWGKYFEWRFISNWKWHTYIHTHIHTYAFLH